MLISIEGIYHDGKIDLNEIPQDIKEANVIVTFITGKTEIDGYDFSDLIGKLSWQGDPVAMQRKLRDEW